MAEAPTPSSDARPDSEFEALRMKYAEIRSLRLAELPIARARPRLVRLAREFPGALRELDALPMETIEERLAALERALLDASEVAPWMPAQSAYHALSRGALRAKRWLAGEKVVDDALRERFVSFATKQRAHPRRVQELLAWADDLSALATPPDGRISRAVLAKAALRLEITVAEARALVLPMRMSAETDHVKMP